MGKAQEVPAKGARQAVAAWSVLSPRPVEHVAVIKKKRHGAVYGLLGAGPEGSRVIAKRCDRTKGLVERAVYEEVLPRLAGPTLECYGVVDRDESIWLFLEDARGERYSPDAPGHREAAARWIGELQASVDPADVAAALPGRGADHYRRFLRSILAELPRYRERGAEVIDPILRTCESLESSWNEIEAFCASAPVALVHGDCLAKNLHIREGRVAVFDWGGAGWGLAATDLGQFALPRRGPPDDEPDCDAYLDAARRRWPQLDADAVRRLASLGQLFWALKVICRGMEEFTHSWRGPEDILADFRIYAAALARSA